MGSGWVVSLPRMFGAKIRWTSAMPLSPLFPPVALLATAMNPRDTCEMHPGGTLAPRWAHGPVTLTAPGPMAAALLADDESAGRPTKPIMARHAG